MHSKVIAFAPVPVEDVEPRTEEQSNISTRSSKPNKAKVSFVIMLNDLSNYFLYRSNLPMCFVWIRDPLLFLPYRSYPRSARCKSFTSNYKCVGATYKNLTIQLFNKDHQLFHMDSVIEAQKREINDCKSSTAQIVINHESKLKDKEEAIKIQENRIEHQETIIGRLNTTINNCNHVENSTIPSSSSIVFNRVETGLGNTAVTFILFTGSKQIVYHL